MFRFKASNSNIVYEYTKDLLTKEIARSEVLYKVNYDEYSRFNYIKEPGGEGMELIDKKCLDKYDKVVSFMLKSIGKNFLAGRDLTKSALPIFINDERTMLDK